MLDCKNFVVALRSTNRSNRKILAAELQAREIRDHLRSLSTTDRQTAIAKIVESKRNSGSRRC